jgi:hypothetical protein
VDIFFAEYVSLIKISQARYLGMRKLIRPPRLSLIYHVSYFSLLPDRGNSFFIFDLADTSPAHLPRRMPAAVELYVPA